MQRSDKKKLYLPSDISKRVKYLKYLIRKNYDSATIVLS